MGGEDHLKLGTPIRPIFWIKKKKKRYDPMLREKYVGGPGRGEGLFPLEYKEEGKEEYEPPRGGHTIMDFVPRYLWKGISTSTFKSRARNIVCRNRLPQVEG